MITQIVYFALIAVLTKLWSTIPELSFYTLQLVALLVFVYLLKPVLFKKNQGRWDKKINSIIMIISVLLLVFSSGGVKSLFFFLLYFLLFGLAFIFRPETTIANSIILIFLLSNQVQSPQDLLKVASLVFVAPLAFVFGKQYLFSLQSQQKIKIIETKWQKDKKSLEKQETSSLMWLSLDFKKMVNQIIEITSLQLADLGKLSPSQEKWIRQIRVKAKKLLKQGQRLQQMIDKETD